MQEKIGHYKIVRLIGKGGMGQVYEAIDEQISRRAAIKLLHARFNDNAELAARFQNGPRADRARRGNGASAARERRGKR